MFDFKQLLKLVNLSNFLLAEAAVVERSSLELKFGLGHRPVSSASKLAVEPWTKQQPTGPWFPSA